jgi:ribose transport system substrate-binding protein
MRKRFTLSVGLAALACAALFGCDSKQDNAPPPSITTSPPGTSGTPATPTASTAFDKPRKADGEVTIKVITNGNDPFWDSMGIGLEAGKKETGVKGEWNAPPQTDNVGQKNVFEQALAANVDGVAVSPIQADAFAPVIDAAIDKGIPVITFDSDSPKSKRLIYIGTNNYEAGKRAGEAAVKLFPNGGNFVAFVGNMSAENAQQRYQGFVDATKDHKIVMLQEPYEDDKDVTGRARINVANAITKYGDKINGFLGLYAYNGPAIVDEVQKAGLIGKVKIVCFDGQPRTLENLRKKLVDVTVVQKPYEFGRLSAKMLFLINRKGLDAALDEMKTDVEKEGMKLDKEKRNLDTGVQVVTPENAESFLKDLEAKGLKST